MTFRSGSKAHNCTLVIDEALKIVSTDGTMKYSMRNLFYKVREMYLKRFTGIDFYNSYDSFTQEFIPKYAQENGTLSQMLREPRGKWISRGNFGDIQGDNDGSLRMGRGNKAILIEKIGLWRMMVANDFHNRLDCCLIATEGFSTEETRNTLIRLEEDGIPIFVVHDFDVNGILIRTSLHKETKRRKTSLKTETIDLGLSWEDVCDLRLHEDGEPVKLGKQDLVKLATLYHGGEICEVACAFLEHERVELNALAPFDLLRFLTDKLVALGYGKTLPEQADLDRIAKESNDIAKERVRDSMTHKIYAEAITHLPSWLVDLEKRILIIRETLEDEAQVAGEEVLIVGSHAGLSVSDVEMVTEEFPTEFWEDLAVSTTRGMVREAVEHLNKDFNPDPMGEAVYEHSQVKDLIIGMQADLTVLVSDIWEP